ncbi:MAG: hypothetical protein J5527_01070 [Treponema sp.]|nr:hypothetical protein [Treponema sp.]
MLPVPKKELKNLLKNTEYIRFDANRRAFFFSTVFVNNHNLKIRQFITLGYDKEHNAFAFFFSENDSLEKFKISFVQNKAYIQILGALDLFNLKASELNYSYNNEHLSFIVPSRNFPDYTVILYIDLDKKVNNLSEHNFTIIPRNELFVSMIPSVTVTEKQGKILFNTAFTRGIIGECNYVRIAYDKLHKVMAFNFLNEQQEEDCMHIHKYPKTNKSECQLAKIASAFNIDINTITGSYKNECLAFNAQIKNLGNNITLLYLEKQLPLQKLSFELFKKKNAIYREDSITIHKNEFLVFSSSFCKHHQDISDSKYVRIAYNEKYKIIALDFTKEKPSDDEAVVITDIKRTSGKCFTLTNLFKQYNINIEDVSNKVFSANDFQYPVIIKDFSDKSLILSILDGNIPENISDFDFSVLQRRRASRDNAYIRISSQFQVYVNEKLSDILKLSSKNYVTFSTSTNEQKLYLAFHKEKPDGVAYKLSSYSESNYRSFSLLSIKNISDFPVEKISGIYILNESLFSNIKVENFSDNAVMLDISKHCK